MTEDRMCNISTTIPRNIYDFVDERHWQDRRSLADIVREAIRDWALARGYSESAMLETQELDV